MQAEVLDYLTSKFFLWENGYLDRRSFLCCLGIMREWLSRRLDSHCPLHRQLLIASS